MASKVDRTSTTTSASDSKDREDEEPTTTIVHTFAEWAMESNFADEAEVWMDEHCDSFRDATLEGEQEMSWHRYHKEFVEWLEEYVVRFCKENDVGEKQFYEAMEDAMETEEDASMFPVFLLNAEYKHFLVEMRSRANKRKTERLAERVSEDAAADEDEDGEDGHNNNFSGIWDPIPEKTSEEEIDEFMEILKIPWYVRTPWKRTMKTAMRYTIVHKKDRYIELTRQARFFGVRTTRYPFDEVVKGLDIEAECSYTYVRESDGSVVTDVARGKCPGKIKKRYGPPGSGWEKIWKFGKDRNELVRVRKIIMADGTTATFHTYYKRRRGGK